MKVTFQQRRTWTREELVTVTADLVDGFEAFTEPWGAVFVRDPNRPNILYTPDVALRRGMLRNAQDQR